MGSVDEQKEFRNSVSSNFPKFLHDPFSEFFSISQLLVVVDFRHDKPLHSASIALLSVSAEILRIASIRSKLSAVLVKAVEHSLPHRTPSSTLFGTLSRFFASALASNVAVDLNSRENVELLENSELLTVARKSCLLSLTSSSSSFVGAHLRPTNAPIRICSADDACRIASRLSIGVAPSMLPRQRSPPAVELQKHFGSTIVTSAFLLPFHLSFFLFPFILNFFSPPLSMFVRTKLPFSTCLSNHLIRSSAATDLPSNPPAL